MKVGFIAGLFVLVFHFCNLVEPAFKLTSDCYLLLLSVAASWFYRWFSYIFALTGTKVIIFNVSACFTAVMFIVLIRIRVGLLVGLTLHNKPAAMTPPSNINQ